VFKAASHDTDTDILEDVGVSSDFSFQLATGITSGNRVTDVSARILARMSVSVSWNAGFIGCGATRRSFRSLAGKETMGGHW